MKPSNTRDELFDVILKNAFTESSEKEIAEYEKEAEQYADITPTEKQRKQARRAYRAAHPKKSAAGRIAASVVLALCLGAAAILSIPSVRAKMSDSFIQIYDTHITYKKTNPAVLRDITVQFIPKGYFYKPSDATETPGIRRYDFINANNQRISLMCASSENPPMIGLDNEFHTIHLEQLDVLLHDGVLRLSQDVAQCRTVERIQVSQDRQTSDNFRNQAK